MRAQHQDALRKLALATFAAVVIVGISESVSSLRRRRRSPIVTPVQGPEILDIDSEEIDESEPEGLQYADDEPCVEPPKPWGPAVSSPYAFEGDDPGAGCVPPADLEPKQRTEVAFAQGADQPAWPLAVSKDPKLRVSYEDVRGLFHGKWGRHFGAKRTSTDPDTGKSYQRVHVGVDLFADDGDIVYTTEPGEIIALLPYYKGTGAVYVLNDSGIIVNYGEVKMNSWRQYDLKVGDVVQARQPIAKVGVSSDGSHMLHIETFTADTTVEQIRSGDLRWIAGHQAPAGVLDPTRYLVVARQATLDEA